jgi:Ca2+-dependent lipid-binding protein
MAKAKNLAVLAGLAGLAYAMRNKPEQENKGRQSDKARPDSTETRLESPKDTIKRSMKKAPEDEESSMQSNMLKAITAPKAASNDQAGNQGVLPSKTNVSKPKTPVSSKRSVPPLAAPQEPSVEQNKTQEDSMGPYKPRYTPPMAAPKTTEGKTYPKKPYMPDAVDTSIKFKKGGMTASSRADGIATKGKTRGRIC